MFDVNKEIMCKSSLHSCGLKCWTLAAIEDISERLWLRFFHTVGTSQSFLADGAH